MPDYMRLILMMAPSFQGGHSHVGAEVAEALGIPFPLHMDDLEKSATWRGYDPAELWPWVTKFRRAQEPQP